MNTGLQKIAKKYLPREIYYDIHHLRNYNNYKNKNGTLREFEKMKCIFVHIPKTGGVSIGDALFENGSPGHRDVTRYRKIFGRKFWSYYKFAFVRNPFTRLISTYEYLKGGGHPNYPYDYKFGRDVIGSYEGFSDFVMRWLKPDRCNWPGNHFIPQSRFIVYNGELSVDFVGKFESIEKDFKKICERLGVNVDLPKKNVTQGSKKPVSVYYSNYNVIERVLNVYSKDFKRFDYAKYIKV